MSVLYAPVTPPSPSLTPTPMRPLDTRSDVYINISNNNVDLNYSVLFQICVLSLAIIIILWLSYLHYCNNVRYVCFTTNLNLLSKKPTSTPPNLFSIFLSLFMLEMLLELEENQIILFLIFFIYESKFWKSNRLTS